MVICADAFYTSFVAWKYGKQIQKSVFLFLNGHRSKLYMGKDNAIKERQGS